MCGIVGGKGPGTFNQIKNSLTTLNRRGPDSQGIINLPNDISFGAARLAMTDPHPRSDQPMVNERTGDVIVFNGEIYNYRKLRFELIKLGEYFRTESDTEALLKYISNHGARGISSLEGMFSFVFYNRKAKEFILARDFLGKKPLYYHLAPNRFFFCSQIQVVKSFVNNCSLDKNAISSYLQLGYIVEPYTMFSEVKTIKPGEILIIDSDTLKVKGQEQYCPKVFGDRVSIFGRSDLQNALIERTTGHSKFALSLSGGIDSAILAVEAKNLNLPVTAYSLRWDDSDKPKYNFDSENAQKIAKRLQIPFTVVSMPKVKEIPELIDTFIMAMEEPHSNPTGVSMLPLYSKIRNDGNRLVLTGDGADEIFGGYPRYNQAQNIKYFPQVNSKYLKNIIQARNFEKKILNKLAITFTECNSKEFWLYWHLIFGKHNFELLFPNSKQFEISPFTLRLNRYFGKNRVRSLMFTDLCTWLTMESNKKLDRISMWNSIEARSPFQSELVINTAYNSMNKSNFKIINKQILKDMYPELKTLPINSQKHGFISPLGHWLRSNPQLVQNSIRYLPQFLPINKSELIRLSQSIVKKNFNEMKMLWSLIILTRWFIKEFD